VADGAGDRGRELIEVWSENLGAFDGPRKERVAAGIVSIMYCWACKPAAPIAWVVRNYT
jgi:hypothetical protein